MPESQRTRSGTALALVMNGGVSLAVWMNGVTHAIANCRRADAPNDQPSRAVWQRHLDSADTRLTVDVIAGTSAGGLNGTVLARAIAQDQDVPSMKRLWLRDAALSPGRLLFPTPNPSASLLNGEYFRQAATGLLAEVPARSQSPAAPTT